MTRIGLLSDTHHYLDDQVFAHFSLCDEIWHAGDFGTLGLAEKIIEISGKPLRGVFGNIDGPDIRNKFPEQLHFRCEEINVFMKHIGGYPGKYAPGVKKELDNSQLFISGHSHILKIMYDEPLKCLHMTPGAAGRQGWQTVRTIVRFTIDKADIRDCEVIELGK